MAEDKAKQREEEERKFAQEDHYKELLRDQRDEINDLTRASTFGASFEVIEKNHALKFNFFSWNFSKKIT